MWGTVPKKTIASKRSKSRKEKMRFNDFKSESSLKDMNLCFKTREIEKLKREIEELKRPKAA
jgi:hypothetical protein